MVDPGMEPRPQWWEASAFTTVPTLLPLYHLSNHSKETAQSDCFSIINELLSNFNRERNQILSRTLTNFKTLFNPCES